MIPDFLLFKVIALLGFLGYESPHLLVWGICRMLTHQTDSGITVRRVGFFPVLERDKASVPVVGMLEAVL